MIRVPANAPRDVQAAFLEIEERLRALETASPEVSMDDLDGMADLIRTTAATLATKPTYLNPNDVFRGGVAHMHGYVPDPGDYPVGSGLVLGPDGTWGRGVVETVPWKYDAGNISYASTSSAQRVVNVHGSLAVLNALSTYSVLTRDIVTYNSLTVGGNVSIGGTITAPTTSGLTASQIANVAAGNIAATNVQTALNELDTEKLALAGGTMTGDLILSGSGTDLSVGGVATVGDANYKLQLDTNPYLYFDSTDYLLYTRSSNAYTFNVGSAAIATIKSGEFSMSSSAAYYPQFSLTNTNADASGVYFIGNKYSASPANNDTLFTLLGQGYNNAATPESIQYGFVSIKAIDIADGSEDGQILLSAMVGGVQTQVMYTATNGIYVAGDCSALSFTDRTKAPQSKSESYAIVRSYEAKDGELDKSKLHPAVRVGGKDADGKPWVGRDVTTTLSALMEVVRDLAARVEALEAA